MNWEQRLRHVEGYRGFLPVRAGHRHHVIWSHCGRTEQFLGWDDLDVLIARVEHSTRYRVDDHVLRLEGLCPSCQEQGA